jgi:beta-glucosidase
MKNGIGQIGRQRERKGPRESALYANAVQQWLKDHTRLGIPVIFHGEVLHGDMELGGTAFPQPLALAASWDPELIGRIFTAAALEVRTRGGQLVLGPNLDVGRDPRWGRTEETYGEDPWLVSRMGVACVKALQGPGPQINGEHVMATAKHFAAHGQPEGGTNIAPANYSERVLRDFFLPSFEAAVKEAHISSVMPSYNEIDGVPSHANQWLLVDILRKEWGFDGLIVSDYYGIPELVTRHHVVADESAAAQAALAAGVDVELPDPGAYQQLPALLAQGKVSPAAIDQAVARVLRAKFLLGLFENPFVDPDRAAQVVNSPAHQALALEAARKSIVLLKNDGGLLPLDRTKLKSIAVIGPNAAGVHLGGYSDDPRRGISLLDGIRTKLGGQVKVNYAEGCKITEEGGRWFAESSHLATPAEDERLITEAVQVARDSDVVVLVLGGNEDTNKEAWADNHLGDRDSIELVGRQNDLARAVLATGRPVVVFLINSGPLAIPYLAENVPAIVEGFYLGQEGGTAAADVLFGDFNPGGKLAITFPRSTGQIPAFYNHKPSAKRGYLFTSKEPLFPFGFGLSYTTFSYNNLKISPAVIPADGHARVSVLVTNSGSRAGDEIVQLYIRDEVSAVTRPVMELKGFERVHLQPGEIREVRFDLGPAALAYTGLDMHRVVEPGAFTVMVGSSSVSHDQLTLKVEGVTAR